MANYTIAIPDKINTIAIIIKTYPNSAGNILRYMKKDLRKAADEIEISDSLYNTYFPVYKICLLINQ